MKNEILEVLVPNDPSAWYKMVKQTVVIDGIPTEVVKFVLANKILVDGTDISKETLHSDTTGNLLGSDTPDEAFQALHKLTMPSIFQKIMTGRFV